MADDRTTRVVAVEVDNAAAIKAIAEYNAKIEESTNNEKALRKAIKERGGATTADREALARLRAEQTAYKRELREVEKELQNNIREHRQNEGSLVSLRAQLSNLTKEYDNLSRAEREGAQGKELEKKIKAVSKELKSAEEATNRFYRNVGNYAGSLGDYMSKNVPAIEQVKAAMSSLRGVASGLWSDVRKIGVEFLAAAKGADGLSKSQKAATITSAGLSAGLKILKAALISTGIGALVVALGSLIAYFTKTQKGSEALSKAMAAVGAAVDVIIDRMAKFGGAIAKLFAGDFTGAWNDMKTSISDIGEELANDTARAYELKAAMIELEKADASLTARRAAEKVRIAELKRISDDTTKSTKERIAAAQEALEIEQRTARELNENGEKRIAYMLGYTEVTEEVRKQIDLIKQGAVDADAVIANLGLAESTIADYKALTNEIAQYQGRVQEFRQMTVEGTTKLNSIRKEAADKYKAALDAELAAVRATIDAEIALMAEGAEKDLATENERHSRKIEDLKKRLATEKNLTTTTREALNRQIELEEAQHTQNVVKLEAAANVERINQEAETIALRLALVKKGTDEEFALKVEHLRKQQEAELANTRLTEEQKELIVKKYDVQRDALLAERAQKQKEAVKLEWDNKIAEARLRGANELDILQMQAEAKREYLKSMRQEENESDAEYMARYIAAAQDLQNTETEIMMKGEANRLEIKQAYQNAMKNLQNAAVGLLEEMGEENKAFAVLSKTIALAEIAVNTGKAIAAGVAQAQSVPFPGNLVAIATTIATIMANITTAIKTVKSAKFAEGGYVSGPGTSKSDSIPARLSNGESVNAALPTSMFAPIYSALNQLGGGAPIIATQSSNRIAGEEMLARAFAKGVAQLDMRVGVDEITKVSNRVKVVESLGNL